MISYENVVVSLITSVLSSGIVGIFLTFILNRWLTKFENTFRIKFSKYHEDQAAAIREVYQKLVIAQQSLKAVSLGPTIDQDSVDLDMHFNDFKKSLALNRIFLEEQTCHELDNLKTHMAAMYGNSLFKKLFLERGMDEEVKKKVIPNIQQIDQAITKQVSELEKLFRKTLTP